MKESTVFDYVVVYAPRDSEDEPTESPRIIEEGRIIARDQGKAAMSIARKIPKEYDEKMDFVELIVRPF